MATVVLTGANRGIGLELARILVGRGDHVLAACRSPSAALEATGAQVVPGVDVTQEEAAGRLLEALAGRTVDLLLHNAGLLLPSRGGELGVEGMVKMFEVNAVAPVRLTWALVDQLASGSKVAIITSRMGSIADNSSGGSYGYRMSKAAVNAGARSLSLDLADRGVAVGLLHPGWVRTDMTHGQGLMDPPESARGLVARIDALSMATTGGFWHVSGERLPW